MAQFRSMVELFREVRRPVRLRSPAARRPGLPGIAPGPVDAEPGAAPSASCRSLPRTAADPNVAHFRNIEHLEPNIHAGSKYMRFILDRYFKDEPMDSLNRALFAFASYNAGPARVAKLRAEAQADGPQPQRVVQQRRSGGRKGYRPGDGDLRPQHLQVLCRVRCLPGARGRSPGGPGAGGTERK